MTASRVLQPADTLLFVRAFDARVHGLQGWDFFLIPGAIALVGLLILLFQPQERKNRVVILGTALTGMFALLNCAFITSEYLRVCDALERGDYTRVEGTVVDFHPGDPDGHQPEQFTVVTADGERYAYSYTWSNLTEGYRTIRARGGMIEDGLHVRIADVGGTIGRLEVAR